MCENLLLPACIVGQVPLRPTLWLADWNRRLARNKWLGTLTCECVEQMVRVRHLLAVPDPWRAQKRVRILCARTMGRANRSQSVGALLRAPERASWHMMELRFLGRALGDTQSISPPAGKGWFDFAGTRPVPAAATAAQGGTLVPLARCPQQCGHRGACVVGEGSRGRAPRLGRSCQCFPGAIRNQQGSCIDHPHRGTAGSAAVVDSMSGQEQWP
jgi:hypothetical protein